MSKSVKFTLVFIGSSAVMFLFLYGTNSMIFDADFYDDYRRIHEELTIKEFLGFSDNLNAMLQENGYQLERKISGWLMLFICLIGLPAMIGLRAVVSKKSKEQAEEKTSED